MKTAKRYILTLAELRERKVDSGGKRGGGGDGDTEPLHREKETKNLKGRGSQFQLLPRSDEIEYSGDTAKPGCLLKAGTFL